MTARQPNSGLGVTLPKWFIFFVSGIVTMVMPWGIWVSHTLIRIDERSTIFHNSAVDNTAALGNLERRVQEHISDPLPHPAAFKDLQRQMDAAVQRLERLEKVKP